MNAESKLLIDALRNAIAGHPVEVPEQLDWQAFLKLAQSHKVEGLVYVALKKSQLPERARVFLEKSHAYIVFRDVQMEYIKAQLQQRLTQAQVPHIFLKGSCLKYDYPIPALRTMSDLDVLVHIEDYDAIDAVCAQMGGEMETGDGNHRNFHFPGGVKVEFHPNIVHQGSPVGTQINPGWQYAKKESPTCSMELTEEGFYLSILCHMADHFVDGGIGIRFVLDVWVFRHLRNKPIDRAFVERELTAFDLLDFAQKIEQLAEVWFGEGQSDSVMDELAEYIVTSGSHGIADRAMLNAVSLSKGGSKASALWSKAFYPREELEARYPWCKDRTWLLPAAWCARAYRAVTTHGKHIVAWGKGTGNFTGEEIVQQKEKMARFGIQRNKKS